MDSIFVLGLIVVGFLNVFYIIDADHCDSETDDHLLKPKIDVNISLEEPDNCSISYMSILNPMSNPALDDGCQIRGFYLYNGSTGPSCIPEIGNLKKDELFSVNVKSHTEEAGKLLNVLLDCLTFEDFKNAALYYKTKVNPLLFSHVFSSAIINREDTEAFSAPTLLQTQPDLIFSNTVIQKATQKVLKDETDALRKYEGRKENFRKFNDDHEMAKYTRNEQIFDETKNNQNFRHTIPSPEVRDTYNDEPNNEVIITISRPGQVRKPPKSKHIYYSPVRSSGPRLIFRKKLRRIKVPKGENLTILNSDLTGNKKNPEHKVSYFREDISINSHHSHWHKMYPMNWRHTSERYIKDRKGELFYYMHNQMLRRYDGARIAEGLPYVKPLEIKKSGTIIEEGYYPHLTSPNGVHFSGRSRNQKIHDVEDLVYWINEIKKAIKNKYLLTEKRKKRVDLDETTGIDLLGAVIESSVAAEDKDLYYGDIHNTGHRLISFVHDYIQEFNAPAGVMYTTETALRDPVFWRWHKMVDDIFIYHKDQLPPYEDGYLTWDTVEIKDLVIKTDNSKRNSYKPNICYTFITNRTVEVEKGLDLNGDKTVWISMLHLDHLPFTYAIKIRSLSKNDVLGHVRIFISPKYTEDKNLATEEELRKHAIEMDRFTVGLNYGYNEIVRKSSQSAVTMTPNSQWAALSKNNVEFSKTKAGGKTCGCGLPSHLLLPKGNETGIEYVIFAMVSNWVDERVDGSNVEGRCGNSLTMCGILNRKFPDKRAMGFPLDRQFEAQEKWFERPNMITKDITIFHMKKIVHA